MLKKFPSMLLNYLVWKWFLCLAKEEMDQMHKILFLLSHPQGAS